MDISKQLKAIDEVMESFNFEKVHAFMTLTKWSWRDEGVPDINKLKSTARYLLEGVMNSSLLSSSSATGGFIATKFNYGGNDSESYTLTFYVESCSRTAYSN
jgi:hypothetical protein